MKNPAIASIYHDQSVNKLMLKHYDRGNAEELKAPIDFVLVDFVFSFYSTGRGGVYVFSPEYSQYHLDTNGKIQLFRKSNKSALGFEFYAKGRSTEMQSLLLEDGMQEPKLKTIVYVLRQGSIYRLELTDLNAKQFSGFFFSNDDFTGFRVHLPLYKGLPGVPTVLFDEFVLIFEAIKVSDDIKQSVEFVDCLNFLQE